MSDTLAIWGKPFFLYRRVEDRGANLKWGYLSGGQVIRRRVAKAYKLDEDTGYGVTFYDFNQLGGNKSATQGDMKKIKQWFRDGINAAPTDDHERTGTALSPVATFPGRSFRWQSSVFDTAKMVDEASLAFVYASEIFDDLREPTKPKEEESKVVYETPASTEKGYNVGSFVAVLGAVCIAHFALVVGGFTGSRGYEKLLLTEDWFASVWQRILGA
jgi:heme oxygenase (biliverdin-producing, ferredoxin)